MDNFNNDAKLTKEICEKALKILYDSATEAKITYRDEDDAYDILKDLIDTFFDSVGNRWN